MKVFLKKMAVIVSAVTILVAISACDLLNGKSKPDDNSSTNNASNTSTTTNTPGTTNGGSTTTNTGDNPSTGGDPVTPDPVPQEVTTVAEFEDLGGVGINVTFYSDNTWKTTMETVGVVASGTYTGDPTQDGDVTTITTKERSEETGELEDCEPETIIFTIADGIICAGDEGDEDDEVTYYIRKSDLVATYGCFMPGVGPQNGSMVTYRFYDNNTLRILENGTLSVLGTYTGDPSDDGNFTAAIKYWFSETNGLRPYPNTATIPETLTITNGCFSGMEGEPEARELEAFKAQVPTEGSETMDTFFRFYADNDEDEDTDGTFLWTYSIMGVEIPWAYGTYTGDPTSTAANNQVEITIKYVYAVLFVSSGTDGEVSPSSDGPSWEVATSTTPVTLTINNNQFTYDIEGETITYTRQ